MCKLPLGLAEQVEWLERRFGSVVSTFGQVGSEQVVQQQIQPKNDDKKQ
jgi:hypothetical protein